MRQPFAGNGRTCGGGEDRGEAAPCQRQRTDARTRTCPPGRWPGGGFKALPGHAARPEPAAQGLSLLRAIVAHPLNALDDVRGGLRFAEFEDEMVPFQRGDGTYDLFATAATGACLFIGRADGRVHWHADWSPDGRGPTFEAVNANLACFARCFCMERAICFRMRAHLAGLPGAEHPFDVEAAGRDERELRDFIAEVDAAALGTVHWGTVLHALGEGLYQPRPGLPHLIQRGRWRVGDGEPD